jgi:hypothetical protein
MGESLTQIYDTSKDLDDNYDTQTEWNTIKTQLVTQIDEANKNLDDNCYIKT